MSRSIISLLFFITAIVIFFVWTKPLLDDIGVLRGEKDSFNKALENSRELQEVRDTLLGKFNSISVEDSASMSKIVPAQAESTELMVELSNIANSSGVIISKLNVQPEAETAQKPVFLESAGEKNQQNYRKVNLSISFSASYEGFCVFLEEIQRSLRLIDVDKIDFFGKGGNLYDFTIHAVAYFSSEDSVSGAGSAGEEGGDFVTMINKLKTLNLDVGFFSSKEFMFLKNLTPDIIPPVERGRKNPFLPFEKI